MNSELNMAKYASELSFLQGYLEEAGISCSLLDDSHGVEIPVLVGILEDEDGEEERPLHFLFVPTGEELDTLQLLQIFTFISGPVDESHLSAVEKLLVAVNHSVGMGNFGLDPENQLYYKYIFPKPKYERWNKDLIMETIFLFLFLMERFEGVLLAAAEGELSVEEALDELDDISQAED
jgi:hypothetical protein